MDKHITLKPEEVDYILAVCDAAGVGYRDIDGAILALAHRIEYTLPSYKPAAH